MQKTQRISEATEAWFRLFTSWCLQLGRPGAKLSDGVSLPEHKQITQRFIACLDQLDPEALEDLLYAHGNPKEPLHYRIKLDSFLTLDQLRHNKLRHIRSLYAEKLTELLPYQNVLLNDTSLAIKTFNANRHYPLILSIGLGMLGVGLILCLFNPVISTTLLVSLAISGMVFLFCSITVSIAALEGVELPVPSAEAIKSEIASEKLLYTNPETHERVFDSERFTSKNGVVDQVRKAAVQSASLETSGLFAKLLTRTLPLNTPSIECRR